MRKRLFSSGNVSLSGVSTATIAVPPGCDVRIQAMLGTTTADIVQYTVNHGTAVAATYATAQGHLEATGAAALREIVLPASVNYNVNLLLTTTAGVTATGGAADYIQYEFFAD